MPDWRKNLTRTVVPPMRQVYGSTMLNSPHTDPPPAPTHWAYWLLALAAVPPLLYVWMQGVYTITTYLSQGG